MRELEDFQYHIAQMSTLELTDNARDEVWLSDLTTEELIVLIHELVLRLPEETSEGWYLGDEQDEEDEEEWDE